MPRPKIWEPYREQHRQTAHAAVRKLEQLGYTFAGDDWMHPANDATAITPTITDELHAMLVRRADDLEGYGLYN